MSRQPSAPVSPEQAKRNTSVAVARGYLLDIAVDRPKRIDQYLDYFGSGGETRLGPEGRAPGSSALECTI
jgi:hypothetical protein